MENNYDLPSGDRIWELASEAKAGRDKELPGRSKQKRKAMNGQAKKKQTKSQNE
jgi:hypothetical protein